MVPLAIWRWPCPLMMKLQACRSLSSSQDPTHTPSFLSPNQCPFYDHPLWSCHPKCPVTMGRDNINTSKQVTSCTVSASVTHTVPSHIGPMTKLCKECGHHQWLKIGWIKSRLCLLCSSTDGKATLPPCWAHNKLVTQCWEQFNTLA